MERVPQRPFHPLQAAVWAGGHCEGPVLLHCARTSALINYRCFLVSPLHHQDHQIFIAAQMAQQIRGSAGRGRPSHEGCTGTSQGLEAHLRPRDSLRNDAQALPVGSNPSGSRISWKCSLSMLCAWARPRVEERRELAAWPVCAHAKDPRPASHIQCWEASRPLGPLGVCQEQLSRCGGPYLTGRTRTVFGGISCGFGWIH